MEPFFPISQNVVHMRVVLLEVFSYTDHVVIDWFVFSLNVTVVGGVV